MQTPQRPDPWSLGRDPLRGFPTDDPDPTQPPPEIARPGELGPPARGFPVDDRDTADPLRITLGQATQTPPDTAAEIFRLRLKTGLPPGVIERNLADVQRQAAASDFNPERFRRDNPQLTRWLLAEPTRAPLVQDDLASLGALETALTTSGNVARALGAGSWRFVTSPWAGIEFAGDVLEWLTGSPQLKLYGQWGRTGAGQTATAIGPETEGMGPTERAVYSGIESLGMNIPAVAAGLATGGTSMALGLMGTSVALESYGQARDLDAPVPRALLFAGTQAGIEVLTEKIPLSWFFKDIATRTGFLKTVSKQLVGEVFGEQVATFFQDLSEWTNLHPEAPASEFRAARLGRGYETLIATVVAAGAQTALITAADRVLRPSTPQRVLEDLHAKTADTKTLARAPTALADFIREAATGLPTVYAAIEPFLQYYQAKGVDPATVAAQLTGDPSAFALALETGDLPIPTESYLTQVVGSGDEAFFATNVRLDVNLPTASELTARTEGEAQARAAEVEAEATAQADVAAEAPGEAQVPPTPQAILHAQVLAELTQGGRVDPATADVIATLVADAFPTVSARTGTDLATLVQRWLPTVQRGTTAAGPGPGGAVVVPGVAPLAAEGTVPPPATTVPVETAAAQPVPPGEAPPETFEQPGADAVREQAIQTALEAATAPLQAELTDTVDRQQAIDRQIDRLERGIEATAREGMAGDAWARLDAIEQRRQALEGRSITRLQDDYRELETRRRALTTRLRQLTTQAQRDMRAAAKAAREAERATPAAAPSGEGAGRGVTPTGEAPPETFEQRAATDARALDVAPAERKDGALLVSTRRPTPTKNTPDADALLVTNLDALDAAPPEKTTQAADAFRSYALLPPAQRRLKTDARVLRASIDAMKQNLRALWDRYPAEWRERAKLWYVGANRIANDLARQFGVRVDQAAGVLAALSPQMDWYKNVSLAERVLQIVTEFTQTNPTFDRRYFLRFKARAQVATDTWVRQNKLTGAAERDYRTDRAAEVTEIRKLVGTAWKDMALEDKAVFLRMHDEITNPRTYAVISPEGDRGALVTTKGGTEAEVGWGTYAFIENAISILENGSPENISTRLGGEHKVRSFYNNISHPWDARSVTIDTHAVAAAFLQAFAGTAREVQHTMGSKPKGDAISPPQHAPTGLSGTNAVVAQAYFELAEELGILPRELQSVTWEAVRSLFKPEQKRSAQGKALAAQIATIVKAYTKGTLSHEDYVSHIFDAAGGFDAPAWAKTPATEQGRVAAQAVRPRQPDVSARPGDQGGVPEGPAGRAAGEPDGVIRGRGAAVPAGDADAVATESFEQGPRARVTFGAGRPLVELFRASNRSSFLHEIGHVFLRMMGTLADPLADQAAAGTPLTPEQQQFVTDYRDIVLPFLGITETAQVGTAQQEQFARAWEAFLMEGKAPSVGLRRVFGTIARWMTRIYKSLQGLSRDAGFEVQLTPEIRAVMNRLLASDAAIEQAEREGGVQPIVTTPAQAAQLGLSPEEFAGYRRLVEAAGTERRAQLAQRMLQDLAREDRAWWKAERARVEAEVTAEVQARPAYRAWFAVRHGTTPAGTPLPVTGEPDAIPVAVPLTLSTADLQQQFGPEVVAALRGLHHEGGLPADLVAPMVGYASGAELVQALAGLPPMAAVIKETTDLRMREAHGDLLLHPEELAEEAQRAVTDQERDAVVRAEIAMLRKLHAATAPVRAAQRAAQRTTVRRLREDVPDRATLDRVAEAQVRTLKLPQIRPDRFFAAAARASRRATEQAAKGHTEEALQAKQDELINLALFRAAQALQDDVEAARVEFAAMFTNDKALATRRNMDYVAAARALAAHYFWPDRRLTQAREALALIEQYNPDLYQELGARIDRVLASGPTLRELTGGGFLDLHEAVSSLWTLSLRDQQSLINGRLEDRAAIVTQLTAHLDTLGPPGAPRSEIVTGLLGLRAALTRVEHWISYVDRQNPEGVFRRYVFQPVADAVDAYRLAKKEVLQQFLAIVEPIKHTLVPGQIVAPELGYTFASKAALLHAIAHSGNPSNLERLLRGRGWVASIAPDAPLDTSVWRTVMDRLFREGVVTKADMDFVQALWDLNESLKPAAQAAHHEMFGYYFHELTAAPVDTPWGTYRGGYVPAILDPFESADGTARVHMDAIEGVAQTMFPPAGFVQRRAEHYAQPLALDLSLLPQHLDKVLRFIHLLPRAKEVNRLVTDRRLADRLHTYDPTVRKDLLQPWLQRAYSQQVTVASTSSGGRVLDRFARALRGNTGLNMMTVNIINVLQQVTGLFPAMTKVKPRYLRTALWRFVHQPRAMVTEIAEQSAFMQETGSGQVAEIMKNLDDLLLNPTKYQKVQAFGRQHGYVLQVMTQNLVSNVTWMGAYEQALEGGADERGAVRQADSAVRETQGSFNPEDIADIERQTPFARLFLMFFGWANMMANLNGYQLAAIARDMGLRKGAGRALYIYTFGFMVPVVLSEVIRQSLVGWDDDDDETHLDELLWLFFGSQGRMVTQTVPGGQVVNSVFNFFNDLPYDDRISVSPAITLLESVVRAPHSVYEAMLDDGPKKRAVRDALSAIGLLTGLPVGAVSRPAGYLADVIDEKVEPETPWEWVRGLVSGRSPPP